MQLGDFESIPRVGFRMTVYKDGPKDDMNNYRPISVISSFAKIKDKLVHNQLYFYLTENNLLGSSQHDF